ncbi:MAG: discoidin domain-containing protein [Desulfomonilaceae bacterium]
MTFIAELPTIMTHEIRTIIYNIQLLLMNQLSVNNLPSQTMVNGFADTFQDEQGVDSSLSTAHYDQLGKYFSEIPGQMGLTQIMRIDEISDVELSDHDCLSVTSSGLSMKKTIISEGSMNSHTDYSTPAMVSNLSPIPAKITASSEHASPDCPAWRAFDQNENHSTNPEECWIAGSTATETVPQWIKIDFGPNAGRIINKYAFLSRNSLDLAYISAPRNFQLLGSNDDIVWNSLDSVQDTPELPSNTWSNYLTFENNVSYRYYKFQITASWGTGLTSLSQLKLIEASYSVPTEPQIAIFSGCSTLNWSSIANISPGFFTPGSSKIFYALSFNKGSDSEKWQIWNRETWKNIAQVYSGTWKYLDSSGTFVDSPENTRLSALKLALGLDINQMDSTALSSVNLNLSQVFTPGELAIAIGMAGDTNLFVPVLDHFSITHDENGSQLDLISRPFKPDTLISSIKVGFLAKNQSPKTHLFVKFGVDSLTWTELDGYSRKVTLANGVGYYSASLSDLETLAGPVRIRVSAPAGTGMEIHGWAVNC